MGTTTKLITAEELLAMGDIGRCELIAGEVVKLSPTGYEHGRIAGRIAWILGDHVLRNRLGEVLTAEGGFVLARDPDIVRAPDVAFVRAGRNAGRRSAGFFDGAPDLAVEVISPSDAWPDVQAKVESWLEHGCESCWVVDPRNQVVSIHRKDGTVTKLKPGQELRDEALPGFVAQVATVFE